MAHPSFVPLVTPTQDIAEAFTRWENDPTLIHLSRPNQTAEAAAQQQVVTVDDMLQRLKHERIYLIYLETKLIGEMNYQVDPGHLFKKEEGTAWISITIGEAHSRGQGIGRQALNYLEQQIMSYGLSRIEIGVFEFNLPARILYLNIGYTEIGRINDFTYWKGHMWQDIRMEKYLGGS
jgi:RimJ/RimL family protein N-acetyltransferase